MMPSKSVLFQFVAGLSLVQSTGVSSGTTTRGLGYPACRHPWGQLADHGKGQHACRGAAKMQSSCKVGPRTWSVADKLRAEIRQGLVICVETPTLLCAPDCADGTQQQVYVSRRRVTRRGAGHRVGQSFCLRKGITSTSTVACMRSRVDHYGQYARRRAGWITG
jgi:hypothetical protein